MKQMGLDFRTWGGRRAGAGRKKSGRAGVPHRRRVGFAHRTPVTVTLRTLPHVWNLRSRRALRALEGGLLRAAQADGARLVQFSNQANHVHLLIEAIHTAALTGRMRSLGISIAKRLNALMGRRGKVLGTGGSSLHWSRTRWSGRRPSGPRRAAAAERCTEWAGWYSSDQAQAASTRRFRPRAAARKLLDGEQPWCKPQNDPSS